MRYPPMIAAALGLASLIGYVWLMQRQGDVPRPWYVMLLLVGSALTLAGQHRAVPAALPFIGAASLLVAGVLGMLSVGLPALAGGIIAAAELARARSIHSSGTA